MIAKDTLAILLAITCSLRATKSKEKILVFFKFYCLIFFAREASPQPKSATLFTLFINLNA